MQTRKLSSKQKINLKRILPVLQSGLWHAACLRRTARTMMMNNTYWGDLSGKTRPDEPCCCDSTLLRVRHLLCWPLEVSDISNADAPLEGRCPELNVKRNDQMILTTISSADLLHMQHCYVNCFGAGWMVPKLPGFGANSCHGLVCVSRHSCQSQEVSATQTAG